jgi:hypothetical protein
MLYEKPFKKGWLRRAMARNKRNSEIGMPKVDLDPIKYITKITTNAAKQSQRAVVYKFFKVLGS